MKNTDEAVKAASQTIARVLIGHGYEAKWGELADVVHLALEAALPHLSQGAVTPTHSHKKRGTDYALIGYGKMQAEDWFERTPPHGDPASIDMSEVAIYRSVDDGSLWVRPREDFEDGRFEDLTPHEPAQPQVGTIAHVDHGKANLSAHVARALAGPTDTQEGMSGAGEVVAWRNWNELHERYYLDEAPRGILKVHDEKNEPLVRQSALTACQQEVERLRDERKGMVHEVAYRHAVARADTAEARNAELTELLHNALAAGLPDEVATPIRAVLGGQING